MSAEIRKLELLPNVERVNEPPQADRIYWSRRDGPSFTMTIQQATMKADPEALRSEARSLFVRFAVRWCRAKSADQGRREAA
jgi:hypothetical protein